MPVTPSIEQLRDRIGKFHNTEYMKHNAPYIKLGRAAVVLPLIWKNSRWEILLTVRSQNLSTHRGDVAYPGGKCDRSDRDEIDTALREAEEEIGLKRSNITEVLGVLHPLISKHGLLVFQVPVIVSANFQPEINKSEVADIFYLPLARFLSTDGHVRKKIVVADNHSPYFAHFFLDTVNGKEYNTWGLTAVISLMTACIVFDEEAEFDFSPILGKLSPKNVSRVGLLSSKHFFDELEGSSKL